MKIMTRAELVSHLQRAMDLGVIEAEFHTDSPSKLICNAQFATQKKEHPIKGAAVWAEAVLDGKYELDIDQLVGACKERELQVVREKEQLEARGGLSREELADKLMQGIANGALGIRHGQIAPYSYGYEVTFAPQGSSAGYKNRWEVYGAVSIFDIPKDIVTKIENGQQSSKVFGHEVRALNIKEMIAAIDEAESKQITSFTPSKQTGLKPRVGYSGHVAGMRDVHTGVALDGIVQHKYHGDYSSMTTGNQNDLVEKVVYLKGFCLDCLSQFRGTQEEKAKIVDYLKRHGTDVSTPEKLWAWIKANPQKCGLESNRVMRSRDTVVDLEDKMALARDLRETGSNGRSAVQRDNGER